MTGEHFVQVVSAETRKLFSRSSARFGLVASILCGVALPMFRIGLRIVELSVAEPGAVLPPIDAPFWSFAALFVRNYLVMRFVLIMVGALSVAGEFQTRTLREDLLRPVPRRAVLVAKWLALSAWVGASLLVTLGTSGIVSIAAGGIQNGSWTWAEVLLAYGSSFLADIGFAAVIIAVALMIRSVAGAMAGMVLFYVLDTVLWVGLNIVSTGAITMLPDVAKDAATTSIPWLPSAAFGVWTGPAWSGFQWQGFVSLGLLLVISLIVSERAFAKLDVP